MTLLMAILPLALLVAIMTSPWPRRWLPLPAHVALPVIAALAYSLRLLRPNSAADQQIHAAAIEGVLSALTPLAIVFGAVLLFKSMQKSGAMRVLAVRLRQMSPDPIAQLMLVGWSFSFLIEGLSGFGTPAALAAPILVGMGFPALRVAAMCLIMNSVPVSFGAVGMPTWFGLGGVDLAARELGEIGWRTALVHAAAAPAVAVLALMTVVPLREILRRSTFVLLVVAFSVGPYLLAARYDVEFPSIVGGLCGLVGAAGLTRWRVGLPSAARAGSSPPSDTAWAPAISDASAQCDATPSGPSPIPFRRAMMPIAATVFLLAITRIEALGIRSLLTSDAGAVTAHVSGLGKAWVSPALVVGLRDILGTNTEWRMPLLYVPFILPFVVVALAAIPLLNMTRATACSVWTETLHRLAKPAVALIGALVLAKLMTAGGEGAPAMLIGRAMADATGPAWPYFAPLLGVLGSFFSGSNTVSNLTFAPIQAAIAETLSLDRATILALQSAGGAMGNMVCIHNIVAVGAVLGLSERRESDGRPGGVVAVLRLTVVPLLVYVLVAAAMAGVLSAVYS